MANTVVMNVSFPKPIKDWIVEEAKENCVSQSTIIYMALKTYKDQQDMLKLSKLANKVE